MADIGKNASMEQHRQSQEGLGIGQLIDSPQQRDAIHVAIMPMVAGQSLPRGDHVRVEKGRAFSADAYSDAIGIVDPFLLTGVSAGQCFWLFLYPGSITSLRHVWTHPGLDAEPTIDRSASEKWMRAWAMRHMSADYYGDFDAAISEDQAYAYAIRAGTEMSVGPYEEARDHIDNEWWAHWEAITGKRGKRGEYFSCAC